ncbi:uncharacterized protein FN964_008044 [Alca torda]
MMAKYSMFFIAITHNMGGQAVVLEFSSRQWERQSINQHRRWNFWSCQHHSLPWILGFDQVGAAGIYSGNETCFAQLQTLYSVFNMKKGHWVFLVDRRNGIHSFLLRMRSLSYWLCFLIVMLCFGTTVRRILMHTLDKLFTCFQGRFRAADIYNMGLKQH